MWQPEGWEFCWRCEELKLKENKKKDENKFRDNSLQRVERDKEIGSIYIETQKTSR
jgi:hypothetical protein